MESPSPFFRHSSMSAEEMAHEEKIFGALAQSVRDLAQASLMTTVSDEQAMAVQTKIEALTEELRTQALEGSFGATYNDEGLVRTFGNAVIGARNPIAVPVPIEQTGDQSMGAEFTLGPLYEGPPGFVHGGVSSLILDQLLGQTAALAVPGMTANLELQYRRPVRLGKCRITARVERSEGIKSIVTGELYDAEDQVCVEARGLFITPRWAREAAASGDTSKVPPRYE